MENLSLETLKELIEILGQYTGRKFTMPELETKLNHNHIEPALLEAHILPDERGEYELTIPELNILHMYVDNREKYHKSKTSFNP